MFDFNGTAAYSLKHQARCISALEGDTDHNTFLLASLVLRDENEIHVMDFNEDTNEVWCQMIYTHPHEVWSCVSCPAPEHQELLITTHANGSEQRTSLWRMEGIGEREASPDASLASSTPPPTAMPELLQLGGPTALGDSRGVFWNAVLPEQVASVHKGEVRIWQLSHGGVASSVAENGNASAPDGEEYVCGRWDPHHAHALGVGCGCGLVTLDTRSMKVAHAVRNGHEQPLRSIDFNPNKPNVLLTAGDDFQMRWWDLRKSAAPLVSLKAHSHWVTCAAFNRFHDQVKTFEEHEHSVFGAVWSAADAWIFASLSLDGKAVINHVPPAEKYKILL